MKIVVDRGRCTGMGVCDSIAPDYFEVGEDGVLVQIRESAAAEDKDAVEDAVRSCPTLALSLVDD